MTECLKQNGECEGCPALAQCIRYIKAGAPYQHAISYVQETECDNFNPVVKLDFNNGQGLRSMSIDGTVVFERDEVK